MFMVTTEHDNDGMFWDDPICAYSEAEVLER